MAVTYTTAVLVKKRVKQISAELTNENIESNILEAESLINAVLKDIYFLINFDETKHRIIRIAATALAATSCIIYDSSGFTSREEANLTLDLLGGEINRSLALLYDERTKEWLKGL